MEDAGSVDVAEKGGEVGVQEGGVVGVFLVGADWGGLVEGREGRGGGVLMSGAAAAGYSKVAGVREAMVGRRESWSSAVVDGVVERRDVRG